MKKIFYTLLLLVGFSVSSYAQASNSNQTATTFSSSVSNYDEKMDAVRSCAELDAQLTQLFGKGYTISDPKVNAQLEMNIADKSASSCIRKNSLHGIYGPDYLNHLNLIDIHTNTNKKTK